MQWYPFIWIPQDIWEILLTGESDSSTLSRENQELRDHISFFSSLAFNLFFIFYVHRVQKVKVGMEKHIRQNVDRVSSKRKKCMLSSTVQSKHNRWHEEVCTSEEKINQQRFFTNDKNKSGGKKGRVLFYSITLCLLWFRHITSTILCLSNCNLVSMLLAILQDITFPGSTSKYT